MLRLIVQAVAACGFLIGFVYHITDFTKLPTPMVVLVWMMMDRCLPAFVPRIVSFWFAYVFLAYQLVSFHDYNACLLEECTTAAPYSYVTLVSTFMFWFTTTDTNPAKYRLQTPATPESLSSTVPKVVSVVEKEIFPALKIRVQTIENKKTPVRLTMGESLQPKWV